MNIKNKSALIIFILIPLAAGSLSALLSGNSAAYLALNKPPLSPPSFLFPIVWTILYILMGISSYIIYESETPEKNKALRLYFIPVSYTHLDVYKRQPSRLSIRSGPSPCCSLPQTARTGHRHPHRILTGDTVPAPTPPRFDSPTDGTCLLYTSRCV